jgi:hypothetical protein
VAHEFKKLRQWLIERVYRPINFGVQRAYLDRLLEFLVKDPHFENRDPFLLISLMTDREIFQFGEFCNSASVPKFEALQNFGVIEILDWLRDKKYNFSHYNFIV